MDRVKSASTNTPMVEFKLTFKILNLLLLVLYTYLIIKFLLQLTYNKINV